VLESMDALSALVLESMDALENVKGRAGIDDDIRQKEEEVFLSYSPDAGAYIAQSPQRILLEFPIVGILETEVVFEGKLENVVRVGSRYGHLQIFNLALPFCGPNFRIRITLNTRSLQFTIVGGGHDIREKNPLDEENGNNVTSFTIRDDGSMCLRNGGMFKLDRAYNPKLITDQQLHLSELTCTSHSITGTSEVVSEGGYWSTKSAEFKLERKCVSEGGY